MDFIDDAVTKAKEAIDIACKKTNEVVNTQKQKFDIAALENKRAKDFEMLGMLYYESIKTGSTSDKKINAVVNEITAKNKKIKQLNEEMNSIKNKRICPKCGSAVDNLSNYCGVCGEKLVFEDKE